MEIEAVATKAGAYAGAAVTAVIGGIGTGLWSLFTGAKMGAVVTHSNAGKVQVEIHNTSIAAKQQFAFINGKLHTVNPDTGEKAPVVQGQFQAVPA